MALIDHETIVGPSTGQIVYLFQIFGRVRLPHLCEPTGDQMKHGFWMDEYHLQCFEATYIELLTKTSNS